MGFDAKAILSATETDLGLDFEELFADSAAVENWRWSRNKKIHAAAPPEEKRAELSAL